MSRKTEGNLKHLSRTELLEMLLDEEKRIAQLEQELARTREALAQRTIQIENSGSIAEAALKLNGIFEAAQAAADQYLENIRLKDHEQEGGQKIYEGKEEKADSLNPGAGDGTEPDQI
jgi:phosphoribosyl-dephospho-CoA transferase